MNDTISIIIPIYNAEKYLDKCLESVSGQSYRNLEIICVDDGSQDGSANILTKWATKDNRIKVIQQSNHGESYARNVGLSLASGSWIAFVDNDDWLELDMYQNMLEIGKKYDTDIVCCSWIKENKSESIKARNISAVADGVFGRDELLKYIYIRDEYQGFAYMWNKLYRKELFQDIYFDERLRIGGDVLMLGQVTLRVRKAFYIDEAYYHYLQRDNSGCHTENVSALIDWIKAYDKVIRLFMDESINCETMLYVKRLAAYTAMRAARVALQYNDRNKHNEAVKAMKVYQEEYEKCNMAHQDWIKDFRKVMEWRTEI